MLIQAQQEKVIFPDFRAGITPSSFLNGYSGVQFSIDKAIKPTVNLTTEIAYIFDSPYQAQGFRIRPGIESLVLRGRGIGLTMGIHGHYRWTKEYRTLIQTASNGEFQTILHNYERTRNYYGGVGTINIFIPSGKRWTWEFGGGLGAARYFINGSQEPIMIDQFFEEEVDFFIDWNYNIGPIFYLHFNISYVISP
ncbi:hypothetical protein GCM10007940_33280 [Portibacter lacus]|uniref:Uncharacterized protein n=2 Tax=Portibacter lacus TaxID=1099794 RepID=A0AA37SRM9_9BACT|nr:hypothetical protein GCM10007940_33280 [Portibacter lacus]